MVPAPTVRRCWPHKGCVVRICGWSSWRDLAAGMKKEEEGEVKGGVGVESHDRGQLILAGG